MADSHSSAKLALKHTDEGVEDTHSDHSHSTADVVRVEAHDSHSSATKIEETTSSHDDHGYNSHNHSHEHGEEVLMVQSTLPQTETHTVSQSETHSETHIDPPPRSTSHNHSHGHSHSHNHSSNSTNASNDQHSHTAITPEDLEKLRKLYDKDGNGVLDDDELMQMVTAYNTHSIQDQELKEILQRYDADGNGEIDPQEFMHLKDSIFSLQESQLRYAAYTASLGLTFNTLLGTSLDCSEALKPIVSRRILQSSSGVSIAYFFGDIGLEAYRLQANDYIHEKTKEKLSLTHFLVERTAFQAVASLILPTIAISGSVKVAKHIFNRIGRYTKWGPSIVGLCVIPFLPLLDDPVEEMMEGVFCHSKEAASATLIEDAQNIAESGKNKK